jgi:3-hydroxy-3-methylglutaryl CoA synthase/uncharacterized OB-fold protein
MTGITACSAYVPRFRLSRDLIAQAWGSPPVPGSNAVCSFDEDALTMAQAAVWRLLPHCPAPAALYFASTSSPFRSRSAAALVAASCDLPPSTATADFAGSTRSAATALRLALDRPDSTVVVAADARPTAPESPEEKISGDAAAAVSVGRENVIAELVAAVSCSDDFPDDSFSSKFALTRGYQANTIEAGRALLRDAGPVTRAVLSSPDGRAHLAVAKALGLSPDLVEDSRVADLGVTGAAMPLLLLTQALDRSSPGDTILLLAHGDGAEGFVFRVTGAIRPLARLDGPTIPYPSYALFRKHRDSPGAPSEISTVLLAREEPQNVRLHGTYCSRCGSLQFPISPVCGSCRNREGLEQRPLSRRGRLFTYTQDYLYEGPVRPTVMAVVDLDGGGRFLCQLTDLDERPIEIGLEVELVLRRLPPYYYWKARRV